MNIAVVGAGIMGQLTALTLLRAGYKLTLYDKYPEANKENCSMAAAGMLTALAELEKAELDIYELGQYSVNNYWIPTFKQLAKPIYFSRKGTLLLAHPQDRAELCRYVDLISSKLIDKTSIQALNQTDIKNLEPELEKFSEGYLFDQDGQLDSQSFMLHLTEELTREGVNWRYEVEATQLKPHKVVLGSTHENFDWVIDCRGLGAKDQFNDLRAVRGELIWLKAREVKLKHLVRLLHPRYPLYVVPRPDHVYLLGATEIESEDKSEISVRTLLELLSAAYYVHPGFAEARLLKTVTHCRPTLADHKPKVKYQKGLIAVNGLYRHGFLLAPALAREVHAYLQQGFSSLLYPHFWEEYESIH